MFTLVKICAVLALVCMASAVPVALVAENTPENIERLNNLGPDDLAEELSGQFEGDMVLTNEQMGALNSRNGLINTRYRWQNKIVYYQLTSGQFTSGQANQIRAGLNELEKATCLKFKERTSASITDYIRVTTASSGCFSQVGRIGGGQQLNLQSANPGSGCFRLGTVIHEFIHALGFYHMQSAHDRDKYVRIMFQNIQSGTENNFNVYNSNTVSHFGRTYDYQSVMHYSKTAFSKNGQNTIVTIDPAYQDVIGQRNGMSQTDIAKINAMYQC